MDQDEGQHQVGDRAPAEKKHSAEEDYVVVASFKDELLQEFKKGMCEWMKPIVERLTSLEAAVSDCKALLRSGGAAEFTGGRDEKFKDLANRVEDLESNVGDLKKECNRQVTETLPPAACTKDSTQPAAIAENDSGSASTPEVVPGASPLPKPRSGAAAEPSDEVKVYQSIDEKDSGNGGTQKLVSSTSSLPKPGSDGATVPSDVFTDHQSMDENGSGIGTQELVSAVSSLPKPASKVDAVPSDENKDHQPDCEPDSDEDSSVAILVANFDCNMRGEAAKSVWGQLTSVAEQVLGKEVRATVLHYDTYVDSIAAAKEDLAKVAEELKLGHAEGDSHDTEGKPKKRRVVGALMTANTNRLAIFHSEQSNTLFPVVKTLREQTETAIILVVSQDFDSKAEPLRLWSPSLQLLLESQVPMRKLNGDEGLLLSLFQEPHFSQARALAAFLSKCPAKEGEVFLPHFPKSQRSHASNAGIEKFLQDLAEVPGCVTCKAVAADQYKSCHPIRNWMTAKTTSTPPSPPPLKPMPVEYRLYCHCTGGNPELSAQMEEFKSRCLPTSKPNLILSGKGANAPVPCDSETCYIAIVFVAAEGHADYLQKVLEGRHKDGFDHCIVAKLFDKSYLDPNRAADLQRHSARKDKDITVVSWFSLPSDVVAEAVLQATRVAVQMKFGKHAMEMTATHGDWHVTLFSGL